MGETNNKISGETNRWLRVGILTLATLGPVINTFLENARKRAEKLQELQNLQTLQELKELKALQELKEHPYSQEVLKRSSELIGRGSQVSQALAEQGGKLTQVIAERGSDLAEQGGKFSHVLVERGSDLTRELSERGSQLSQDLAKRGEVITREAAKRGRQATQNLAKRTEQVTDRVGERPLLFWLTFGFGLATAAIATYQIVRKRFLQREAEQIQIMQNGRLNGSSSVESSAARPATQSPTIQIVKEVLASQAPLGTETEQSTKAPNDYPADSRVLGLVSNKRYYPIDTSLDQLRANEGGTLDVIYFASEDEARAQGFTAAE